MLTIVSQDRIRASIDIDRAIAAIEDGFAAYSRGRAVVPPVGHLVFERPPGDCHIKYGYVRGDDEFVIKVATGFHENPSRGARASNGLMLVLSARTGEPEVLLDDGGWLTDLRTAIAGLIAARHLARRRPACIGVVGTGIQAGMQLELLLQHYHDAKALVWGRDRTKARTLQERVGRSGHRIELAPNLADLCTRCDLIVTATPSAQPLLYAEWIQPGTHITAVGADAPGKQELDPAIFRKADLCVVDSVSQCVDHGDASHAVKARLIRPEALVELGAVIAGVRPGRTHDEQITIADLTGLAVQDIRIAQHVLRRIRSDG